MEQMEQRVTAVWTSTNRCNLNCKFCFGKDKKTEIETEEAKRLIQKMKNLGVKYFVFSGGEPLLRKDLFTLANFAKSIGMKVFLHTNGILINRKNADEIAQHFDVVNVPIDGATEESNHVMGRGSLKHTIEVIDLLAGKCEIRVTTVATKVNISEIEKIADLIRNEKISKWRIFQFDPKLGEAKINKKMFEISSAEFAKIVEKVKLKNYKAEFIENDGKFEKKYWLISSDGTINNP